jgi:hypothetical protein
MNTEADIVERLRNKVTSDHKRGCQGREYGCSCGYDDTKDALMELAAAEILNLRADITELRAERDAAAREMREQCAKVAINSYNLMFPKPRNRITAENAGHAVARAIRALPDASSVVAPLPQHRLNNPATPHNGESS